MHYTQALADFAAERAGIIPVGVRYSAERFYAAFDDFCIRENVIVVTEGMTDEQFYAYICNMLDLHIWQLKGWYETLAPTLVSENLIAA